MNWNFNMSEAPRGRTVAVTRAGEKAAIVETFVPDKVILATKCGKVIASHFMPKEQRWLMLAAGEQPVAWQPWPSHPRPQQPEANGGNG